MANRQQSRLKGLETLIERTTVGKIQKRINPLTGFRLKRDVRDNQKNFKMSL